MKKMLFYSHDAYGLDTIRRTMSICQFLLATIPGLSIKIITGSSIVDCLRIPEGIEFVQLPSGSHTDHDAVADEESDRHQVFKRRADTILGQVIEFQPDLILVDKTPYGVQNELLSVLAYRQEQLPQTKMALILQDIIDSPTSIKEIWKKRGFFDGMERHFDQIFVLGSPRVFDSIKEYGFSSSISAKTKFLGYMRRSRGMQRATTLRSQYGIGMNDPLVLITSGDGSDDVEFFDSYLNGFGQVAEHAGFTSLVVLNAEMSNSDKVRLTGQAQQFSKVHTLASTDDLMSYLEAADLIVSRGGYRSLCEILTLNKPAVVIPRVELVQEQSIRATRMARLGLLRMIHPDQLTVEGLIGTIQQTLQEKNHAYREALALSLDALPQLSDAVATLLQLPQPKNFPPFPSDGPGVFHSGSGDDVMKQFFSVML